MCPEIFGFFHDKKSFIGKEIWQDTERLSGGTMGMGAMGMFEQIASALSKSKVLLACVSKENLN